MPARSVSQLCKSGETATYRSMSGAIQRRSRRYLGLSPSGSVASRPCSACTRRSEEHTSELQSLMRISYAGFCFTKKKCVTEQHTDSAAQDTDDNKTRTLKQVTKRAT